MRWTPIDIRETLESPRPVLDFVLPGLPAGTIGLLVGQGGIGKTMFLIQLAVSLTLGLPAFGELFPESYAMKVVLIVAEEVADTMKQRLHDIMEWLLKTFPSLTREGLIQRVSERLIIIPLSGVDVRLVRDGAYTDVLKRLQETGKGARLIIADPLRRFHDGDENDSGAMTRLVQGFEQIAGRTGAAVLLAHHVSKGVVLQGQGGIQQAARGSSALTDGVRWQANLTAMSTKDAIGMGLGAADVSSHVRFDISKTNYGPTIPPVWLRRMESGILTRVSLPGKHRPAAHSRSREVIYE